MLASKVATAEAKNEGCLEWVDSVGVMQAKRAFLLVKYPMLLIIVPHSIAPAATVWLSSKLSLDSSTVTSVAHEVPSAVRPLM